MNAAPILHGHRMCADCRKFHKLRNFSKRRRNGREGYVSYCKDCQSIRNAAWRALNPKVKAVPVEKPESAYRYEWPRLAAERECDMALRVFMGVTASPVAGGRI